MQTPQWLESGEDLKIANYERTMRRLKKSCPSVISGKGRKLKVGYGQDQFNLRIP